VTDLATISVDDLVEALEPSGSQELGKLDDLILLEVRERLGDESRRKEIPGTVLMQLARDVFRVREQEAARKVEQVEEPSPLSEIIDQAGLPDARKRELVRAEILRVTAELDLLNGMLDGLEDK